MLFWLEEGNTSFFACYILLPLAVFNVEEGALLQDENYSKLGLEP